MSRFRKIMLGVFVAILLQCSISFAFQRKLIFHERPLPANHIFKAEYPYKEYVLTRHIAKGETVNLNALYYSPLGEKKGTVFYLHGTLGNMQTQEKHLHDFLERGYAVFTYDYRTYGKSTGSIYSETDMHEDAAWVYGRFKDLVKIKDSEVTMVGRSLGTGLAVPLASDVHPKNLILISPYYEMADVAKRFMPYLPKPLINKALRFGFHTDERIAEVQCPLYVFHGTKDELIPYSSGKAFEPYTKNGGRFIPVPGGGHLDLTRYEAFQSGLDSILSN
jgi:uncharacterized protein